MQIQQDAVALVTGAGQGVGREIALQFARHGAGAVIINDVNAERAEAVAEEVRALGTKAAALVADVTDFQQVEAMVAKGVEACGPITILVNNAGNFGANPNAMERGAFWEVSPSSWEASIGVNLYGPLNCSRAVLAGMVERGGGRIITIISDAGRVGEAGLEAYSAAKAGAAGFTRALARSVGRYGITANNVAIAATRTPFTAGMLDDADTVKKMMSKYVIRRTGRPEDVAPVVLLLASEEGSFITGQTYPVNGGFSFNQ
jgi:3-oxoacyl-[acyl-carrier protein] reductase